ncbi:MAG: hypothetical protein U9R25_12655 [Chloroflexota bacterium]|nr:hypothetical protein [Chloroflexota bacterium]
MRQKTRGHGEGATRGLSPHPRVAASSARAVNIKLSFPGSNPDVRIETFDPLDTVVSYFIGNDADQWQPDVPVWDRVRYVDLYPGIDFTSSTPRSVVFVPGARTVSARLIPRDELVISPSPTPPPPRHTGRGQFGWQELARYSTIMKRHLDLTNAHWQLYFKC